MTMDVGQDPALTRSLQGQLMLDAEEVAAMKRLHELGWGAKRISLLALRPAARSSSIRRPLPRTQTLRLENVARPKARKPSVTKIERALCKRMKEPTQ